MTLEDWRREIDAIDKQLVLFLNERARLAAKLVATKTAAGSPIYDSARETSVLNHVCTVNVGPFADDALKKIFRRIIVETRRVEIERSRGDEITGPERNLYSKDCTRRKEVPQ